MDAADTRRRVKKGFVGPHQSLAGQTVAVIGGSAGIGLESARLARSHGAELILTARDPRRLEEAAREVDAVRTHAFDINDAAALQRFFQDQRDLIDHVMITAGSPRYGALLAMPDHLVREVLTSHITAYLAVARHAHQRVSPHGSLVLMGGTGGRRITAELGIVSALTAALPPFTAALALELAPIRVNLIAAGFVDTGLSAALLGDALEQRRAHLRATLPIGRVVTPADVAALAIHLMSNTAITGATYDIDGGQQFTDP
jgi:NAD(P)-dependent dehydrogenase (short-subunit alcohol dehydrogenase family)